MSFTYVLKKRENGIPLSRDKAQTKRETEARTPKSTIIETNKMMRFSSVAPTWEPVT